MKKGETANERYIRLVNEERERRIKLGENTFSFNPILVNNNEQVEFQGKMSNGKIDISDFFIKLENINIYEKNILNYKVLIQLSNEKYILHRFNILDNETLLNAILILTKIEDEKYFTIIYKGNKKIFEEETQKEYFLSYPYGRILFSKMSSDNYMYDYYEFSFITLKGHYLGKSKESNVNYLRINYAQKIENYKHKIQINKKIKLNDKQNIYFIVSRKNNKWLDILLYFCKMNLIDIKRMENQFTDDFSENYIIEIDKCKKDEISFMDFCCKMGNLYGITIYNRPIQILLQYLSYSIFKEDDILFQKVYFYCMNKELEFDLKNEYLEVIDKIKKKLHTNNIEKLIDKIYYIEYTNDNCEKLIENYQEKNNMEIFSQIDYFNGKIKEQILNDYKKTASEIFDILVDKKIIDIVWKNEYRLYRLIKKYFNLSIYQYRPRWLVLQSLDIYVPEINLGIEYQGEQHFKSIDFFGGDSGLEYIKKRDENKNIICKRNGVKILYWDYNIEVNEENIKKQFKKIGIEL